MNKEIKEWQDIDGRQVDTVGDLIKTLSEYSSDLEILFTDGDRTYNISVAHCRVVGRESPGKRWERVALFFSID